MYQFSQNSGKYIQWDHVKSLYLNGTGSAKKNPGLCLVPKLKYEHIYLNSFSKMRVDLAAQVCTNTSL